jgi:predicted esterase
MASRSQRFFFLAVCLAWALGAPPAFGRGTATLPRPPEQLEIKGFAPAYYYPPRVQSQMRPAIVYLHGRGGYPEHDCMKWRHVASEIGWLICPSGPEDRGDGARGWANDWVAAKTIIDRSIAALRAKVGRKVQLRGNTLIGFSEGAFIAMNVGVREPRVFNRWLILAATDWYWGGDGEADLKKSRHIIKRVYLLTGDRDEAVDATRRVFDLLDEAGVHVLMRTPEGLAHEVPADKMRLLYRRPLRWLNAVK